MAPAESDRMLALRVIEGSLYGRLARCERGRFLVQFDAAIDPSAGLKKCLFLRGFA